MKKAKRHIRLSVKLTLTYAGLFIVILAVLSAGILLGTNAYTRADAKKDLDQTVIVITERLLSEHFEGEALGDPEVTQGISSNPAFNITLRDSLGNLISNHHNFDGMQSMLYSEQAIRDGQTLIATVRVERSLANEQAFLSILTKLMLIFDIAGTLIALLVGYVVARRMLKPIGMMTETAQRISMSALSQRIEHTASNDELSALAKTFNGMLDRLQTAFVQQSRFVSDASHELRTPLMVIHGYAGMLERWGKYDEKVLQEAISAISRETENMSELIDRLLFLARSDANRQSLGKVEFSFAELIDEVIKEFSMLAPSCVIQRECSETVSVFGDRAMIKQMVRALLNNAVKYTFEGAIRISCNAVGNTTHICVSDDGIGIGPDDLPHIFDRFYRVDEARARATGGSGLGLPIVKQIISAHGGSIEVTSELGKGTTFYIDLPAAE